MKKYILAMSLSFFFAISGNPTYAFNVLEFKTFVQVSPFADGENWFLTQPLEYKIRNTNYAITVPDGFVTDFASIPQPLWSILPKWGKYGPPSVVHDFLYWDQQCSREQADAIFLAAMEESNVSSFRRFFIHLAVRWGGKMSWKANTKVRTSGKTREIPKSIIDSLKNPNTEWKEFQQAIFNQGHVPEKRPSSDPPPDYCSAAD